MSTIVNMNGDLPEKPERYFIFEQLDEDGKSLGLPPEKVPESKLTEAHINALAIMAYNEFNNMPAAVQDVFVRRIIHDAMHDNQEMVEKTIEKNESLIIKPEDFN